MERWAVRELVDVRFQARPVVRVGGEAYRRRISHHVEGYTDGWWYVVIERGHRCSWMVPVWRKRGGCVTHIRLELELELELCTPDKQTDDFNI